MNIAKMQNGILAQDLFGFHPGREKDLERPTDSEHFSEEEEEVD